MMRPFQTNPLPDFCYEGPNIQMHGMGKNVFLFSAVTLLITCCRSTGGFSLKVQSSSCESRTGQNYSCFSLYLLREDGFR